MNAEIISIGTEILLGEIVDTNSVYLSRLFAKLGIDVFHQTTVGDNETAITNALKTGTDRSDLIVTIGGLGPTEDDITKQSMAKFLNADLKFDNEALDKIENRFKKQGRIKTKNNDRQALILENAEPIKNPNGLAIGLFYHTKQADYVVLPGPPSEFEVMVDENLLQLLSAKYGLENTIQSKTLHFTGIGESELATRIQDLVQNQSNPTIALYFKPTDVTVRLTAKTSSKQEADKLLNTTKDLILQRVGDFFYAEGDHVELTDYVMQQLIQKKITLTAAESLTAGDFQKTIVQTPGVSAIFPGGYVTYANEAKMQLLGVKKQTLKLNSVVSKQVAQEMAFGALTNMNTDLALSFTGAAGPEPLEGHQPGNVWIGLASKDGMIIAKEFNFEGNREKIRHLAVLNGFRMIMDYVIK